MSSVHPVRKNPTRYTYPYRNSRLFARSPCAHPQTFPLVLAQHAPRKELTQTHRRPAHWDGPPVRPHSHSCLRTGPVARRTAPATRASPRQGSQPQGRRATRRTARLARAATTGSRWTCSARPRAPGETPAARCAGPPVSPTHLRRGG